MSSTKKKLTINALSAIIQVTFTALLYFFLYKYLLVKLGVRQLGVWSLILSFSSIANLANLGITSGLVKFVAEYIAEKQEVKIGKLILTSFLSMVILFSILSLLILFSARYFLHFVIDQEFLSVALSILPFSLGSLCVNAAAGVFTSVIEGFQKNYLRNFIYVFSGIVMYIATVFFTPTYQLQGVAFAQLIQAISILLLGLILIYKVSPFNHFSYWRWSNESFKELFNYGYKFQIVSVNILFCEPITKLLLSKFGGLTLLGNYEMASRLVSQFRALLVNANQVVIPVVAEKVKTQTKMHLKEFYVSMNRNMFLFTLPLSTLLILLTPFVSIIWIGHLEHYFIYSVYVLVIANVVNIMSSPAYFSCMGEGRLNILIISHICMTMINLILGYFLGCFLGGIIIIIAWPIANIIGSLVTIKLYQKTINLSLIQLLDKNEWQIFIASCLLISLVFFLFLFDLGINSYIKTFFLGFLFAITYFPIIKRNKSAKDILLNIYKIKNSVRKPSV